MSEVFDEYFVILNSMLDEYTGSYEEKEFAYCNKSFIYAKMFQAFYSKDVKSYIEFDEKYIKIIKHHKTQPYSILCFHLVNISLMYCIDAEKLDKNQFLNIK